MNKDQILGLLAKHFELLSETDQRLLVRAALRAERKSLALLMPKLSKKEKPDGVR
jgi:hypothetical protein